MWTTILASYAAVVSTSSLIVSYLSYRSGDPRLSGRAEIVGRYDLEGPTLHIAVHNRGRGSITVDSFELWGLKAFGEGKKDVLPLVGWPLHSANSELPARIEGHSGGHWYSPAQVITKDWLTRDELTRLALVIQLADGKILIFHVDTSNVDVLDPGNLSDWESELDSPAKPRHRGL